MPADWVSTLFFVAVLNLVIFSLCSRLVVMLRAFYLDWGTEVGKTSQLQAEAHKLRADSDKLRTELEFLKTELTRSQLGRLYLRAGDSIFAKLYVDREGKVLVTDNLFCRMLADARFRRPTDMQFLPDSLRGLLRLRLGSQEFSHFTVVGASSQQRLHSGDCTAAQHVIKLQTSGTGAAVVVDFPIVVRTGVPNDASMMC
jgi:hypothetical protein